jgi:hypothetical protein
MSIGPIDLSSVNWVFVGLMMALTFVAALLGSLIAFKNRFMGSIFAAILFGIGFVAWNYYPHNFGLPILRTTALDGTVAPVVDGSAPPAPPASAPPTAAPTSPPGGTMAPPPSSPPAPGTSQ